MFFFASRNAGGGAISRSRVLPDNEEFRDMFITLLYYLLTNLLYYSTESA
jgi:hypothetical protein